MATGFFSRLSDKLGKTRQNIVGGVRQIVTGTSLTDDTFDELEATLIQADLGIETVMALVADMRVKVRERRISDVDGLLALLKEELIDALDPGYQAAAATADGPWVTLIVGVNGSGKTTTAGKIAAKLARDGQKVMLGAADTFRAAAVEQLAIWSERAQCELVRRPEGSDPASVAYETVDLAIAKGHDRVIIDTAGRLHTKVNLMEELGKVHRVIGRRMEGAPHEVLLVLDATTGQNALQQAKMFTAAIPVTGIVLTKLDGTAKGGIVVPIQKQLGLPIKLIGVGEGIDDLQPFDRHEFVEALFHQEPSKESS